MKTYTLEPRIRQQINEIGSYRSFLPQLNRISFDDYPETYVIYAREAHRSGDAAATQAIMSVVTQHLYKSVFKRSHFSNLHVVTRRDITEDIVNDICVLILGDQSRGKFFSVKFWWAVKCHIVNVSTGHHFSYPVPPDFEENNNVECYVIDNEGVPQHWVQSVDQSPGPDVYAQIQDALGTLQPRERAVFLANRYLGLTQREIAAKLNISTRTVTDIIGNANRKLAAWREAV